MSVFNTMFYANPLYDWLIAVGIMSAVFLILLFSKRMIASHLQSLAERTVTDVDDLIAQLVDSISPVLLLVLGFYAGSKWLLLETGVHHMLDQLLFISVFIQLGFLGSKIMAYLIKKSMRLQEFGDPSSQTTLGVLGFMSRLVLWSLIFLLIFDNLGFNITTLIASLGIGGIAVALAAQSILGELFASISIALDKPFVIGDFIIIDTFMGTIEKIGMRTTQIRSLSGELIIFSNTDLLKSRIRNFKRMQERRITFKLDVVYGTPYDTVCRIPDIIRNIIEAEEIARFDRGHFKEYGSSSLIFEFVYYVLAPDYNVYMDIQQRVNLAVYRKFEEEGIDFAFPTQTVHYFSARKQASGEEKSPPAEITDQEETS
ncbi:MAG: mechanosensitive ion channel family protein [Bacteroidetes bacterium]|nr:mechanosensitive ion channel family protein [Bacteroidota bacterium]